MMVEPAKTALGDVIFSWKTGATETPLEYFSPEFFNGGLVRAYWQKETDLLRKSPDKVLREGFLPPPIVEVDDVPAPRRAGRELALIVVATDQGGGIGPIHLYHNGKLVRHDALVQQQDVTKNCKHLRAAAFRVTPSAGPNIFEGVVASTQGVEDRSKKAVYLFDGSDEAATRDNLRKALLGLRDGDARDTVIVYLAGHGLIIRDDWAFLTHEAGQGNSEADFVDKHITAAEIRDALVESPAQRILLLIDSCFSGAGIKHFERYQTFQRRFLRDISRTTGITVLAAAQENQGAAELRRLGHGLFTYVLISGLAGAARLQTEAANGAGPVTAHELVRFTSKEIAAYAGQLHGHVQESAGFALGADFTLRK